MDKLLTMSKKEVTRLEVIQRIEAKDLKEEIKMMRVVTSHDYGVTGLNTGCGCSFGSVISGSGSGSYLWPVPILPNGM